MIPNDQKNLSIVFILMGHVLFSIKLKVILIKKIYDLS
jgi:hypothetical protein